MREPGLESNLSDYRSMHVPLFYFAKNGYDLAVGGIELSTIDVQKGEKFYLSWLFSLLLNASMLLCHKTFYVTEMQTHKIQMLPDFKKHMHG